MGEARGVGWGGAYWNGLTANAADLDCRQSEAARGKHHGIRHRDHEHRVHRLRQQIDFASRDPPRLGEAPSSGRQYMIDSCSIDDR